MMMMMIVIMMMITMIVIILFSRLVAQERVVHLGQAGRALLGCGDGRTLAPLRLGEAGRTLEQPVVLARIIVCLERTVLYYRSTDCIYHACLEPTSIWSLQKCPCCVWCPAYHGTELN